MELSLYHLVREPKVKKDKNKKVNLGGPGKRTPRKTESRNRGVERKRDEKKKKK